MVLMIVLSVMNICLGREVNKVFFGVVGVLKMKNIVVWLIDIMLRLLIISMIRQQRMMSFGLK